MKLLPTLLLVCASGLLLAGCATGYHTDRFFGGGFKETQLAPDVWRITFRGNGYTSSSRAQDFALLRATDLVLTNGYTCFALLADNSSVATQTIVTSEPSSETTTTGTASTSGTFYGNQYSGSTEFNANSHTTYSPGSSVTFYKPTSGLLIRAYKVKPADIFTFDAAFLQQQLAAQYGVKYP